MTPSKETEKEAPDSLLIFGDWVVDEYWFLVRHHSAISSHVGFDHYRVSTPPHERFSDLCGAGHVARVLHDLRNASSESYNLVGIGKWNAIDTNSIGHLVHARHHPGCLAARATYTVNTAHCDEPIPIQLFTLAPEHPTIRVVRMYHEENGGLEQINRVDWEPPPQSPIFAAAAIRLADLPLPPEATTRAIVVNDLARGVVTPDLVRDLKDRYPHANWFVRSKDKDPQWLTLIGDSLRLYIVGPEVAAQFSPTQRWTVSHHMSLQALEVIGHLPGDHVVLLSQHREIIGRLNRRQDALTARSSLPSTVFTQLGWPTAFFASLVRAIYRHPLEVETKDIELATAWADEHAGVPAPDRLRVSLAAPTISQPGIDSWKEEEANWLDSQSGTGIVEVTRKGRKERVLQVWRSWSQLSGYVCCVQEKRRIIDEIGRRLAAFRTNPSHSAAFSLLLQADPGAGKTYLARSLAKEYDFNFLAFDITQMIHRDELLDLFEAVSTLQARSRDPVLVFVDEINALLDNSQVYGAYLAPLEEGFYVRRGRTFSLKPCVWVFAGTKLGEDERMRAEKLSDFRSRVSLIKAIDYKSLKSAAGPGNRFYAEARLEQVYIGAVMLRSAYSDIGRVSMDVIRYFQSLDPSEAPARKIRKLVETLENVQYGTVTKKKNCRNWQGGEWADTPEVEEELIRLEF